jgi:hypothetical protein
VRYPTNRLRLGSVLFWAAGVVCLLMLLSSAADVWVQFQATRAAVAADLGRMP